jgi:hypothetical protein
MDVLYFPWAVLLARVTAPHRTARGVWDSYTFTGKTRPWLARRVATLFALPMRDRDFLIAKLAEATVA